MTPEHCPSWPAHLPHRIEVPQASLVDNLADAARRTPQRTAVDFYGRRISYGELLARVERLAGRLRSECGVDRGDRVLLDMQNSPAFIVAYYAILRAGAVVVPVNPMNRTDELHWIVSDSGARVACAAQEAFVECAPLLRSGLLDRVLVAHYGTDLPPDAPQSVPPVIRAPLAPIETPGAEAMEAASGMPPAVPEPAPRGEDIALIAYTSGTTGNPKGCMLSHRALQAGIVAVERWNGWDASAVTLATAPFFHVTGMQASMNLPLRVGGSIVVLPRWDRDMAAELLESRRITHWTNIPTMVSDLLAIPGIEQRDFSSLRHIGGGGTAMPEAVATRLHELTGQEYQEGWGLTEVCGPIHLNPPGAARRQCLGVPVFGIDTRVVDADSGAEVATGAHGELVTRGPTLFSGYWRNPEATEASFVTLDGERYFRTGDIGWVGEDGYFTMADRLKRMINASGYKVWPAEVESILFRHPAVQEACVVGARDPYRGETVKALVVLRDGLAEPVTPAQIIDWSRGHMAAYKIPRIVEIVESLPRSGTGKVLWRTLQERERQGGGEHP